jgi:hypothetical protein
VVAAPLQRPPRARRVDEDAADTLGGDGEGLCPFCHCTRLELTRRTPRQGALDCRADMAADGDKVIAVLPFTG